MSHIVTIKTEIRDPIAVAAACRRLGLAEPEHKTVRLFSGEATGLTVQLPGWRYPVVAEVRSGKLRYDNYQGRWGDQIRLDELLQCYAVEKTRIEARKKGHSVSERRLADGSIKLVVNLGGAA